MDRSKALAGLVLYGLGVALPTVDLLLSHEGIHNASLERILVGALGLLSGRLVWGALRAPRPNLVPTYWGLNPWLLGLALLAFYLAWFTNLPQALAGRAEVLWQGAQPLDALWPRIATSAICAVAVALLARALRTTRSPEQRRVLRIQKRLRKTARNPGTG